MKHFEIIPGKSVGPFVLGQHINEIRERITEPVVFEEWMGGNLNDSILLQGLVLNFDKYDANGPVENSKFVSYRLYKRINTSIFGKLCQHWTLEEMQLYLKKQSIEYVVEKEVPPDVDLLLSQTKQSLSFENGILVYAEC